MKNEDWLFPKGNVEISNTKINSMFFVKKRMFENFIRTNVKKYYPDLNF